MISNTHYLYYCTQIVAVFALTHYNFPGFPLLWWVPLAPKSGDSHQTNKCQSPYLKNPFVIQVQKYFDVVLSTFALYVHLQNCQVWVL
jgi:hypothetical protein